MGCKVRKMKIYLGLPCPQKCKKCKFVPTFVHDCSYDLSREVINLFFVYLLLLRIPLVGLHSGLSCSLWTVLGQHLI